MPHAESTSPASFSLAGFQVTLIGRFWVTPEGQYGCEQSDRCSLLHDHNPEQHA
jgi:hypothetical protein